MRTVGNGIQDDGHIAGARLYLPIQEIISAQHGGTIAASLLALSEAFFRSLREAGAPKGPIERTTRKLRKKLGEDPALKPHGRAAFMVIAPTLEALRDEGVDPIGVAYALAAAIRNITHQVDGMNAKAIAKLTDDLLAHIASAEDARPANDA